MAISTEQKVGLFFLLALVALAVMIELVEDWRPFETQHDYHAFFQSAIGIKKGDPVRLGGVDVGKVNEIGIADGKVRIDFHVIEDTTIKKDSNAMIRQSNLLGGQFLGLTFGSESAPVLPPGSAVETREGADIDQLITSFDRNQDRVFTALGELLEETRGPLTDTVSRINKIMTTVEQGEGTIGRLVNDPVLYEEMQGSVASLGVLLDRLEKGEGSLGRLMNDPALYEEARQTVANLRTISDRVREGEGSIGRLFADETLYSHASDALENIRDISGKANAGTGSLGKLVNEDALYEETRATMTRLHSIAAKIDDGKGTMGRLVNEDDIYRDTKTTLHKVEKAVDGINDTGPLSALGVVIGTMF